jgi:hypothetical protein
MRHRRDSSILRPEIASNFNELPPLGEFFGQPTYRWPSISGLTYCPTMADAHDIGSDSPGMK